MITLKYKCGHTEESNCYDAEKTEAVNNLLHHLKTQRMCLECYKKEIEGNMGNIKPNIPTTKSKLTQIKDECEKALAYLNTINETIEILRESLHPVLRQEPGKLCVTQEEEQERLVPLAEEIRDLRKRIEKANDEIMTIIGLVEL